MPDPRAVEWCVIQQAVTARLNEVTNAMGIETGVSAAGALEAGDEMPFTGPRTFSKKACTA